MSEEAKKILIRGVNWIGDAVLTLPAIRAIRCFFPDSHISLLVKPWVSELFKENPYINEIILYEDTFNSFTGKFKLSRILQKKGFDIAILLQNAFDAALISWLSGIPERIGYRRDWRSPLLTRAVPVKKDIPKQHQVNYYLNLLRQAGIETTETEPFIFLTDDEREKARSFFNSSFIIHHPVSDSIEPHPAPLIGINPGATYGSAKRWPSERFAELIQRIIYELNGRVVIFGSPSEVEIANEIVLPITHHPSPIINMAGKTNLRELAALISECDAFITNDSGPMHIASALKVPTIALFGSTDSMATGPLGEGHKVLTKNLPCAPCLERECPEGHLKCMTEISTEEVFYALQEILPKEKAIFLDRDGTIIEDKNYLNSFDDLIIFPNVKENLQRLKKAGFKIIGITNQSGIAKGVIEERFVIESNAYLQKELGIDDFYYCPHHPDEHCPCRKPEPMLILRARLKHKIRLKDSYVIGDKESDVLLARKVGARGILLSVHTSNRNTSASYVAMDFNNAVELIFEKGKRQK